MIYEPLFEFKMGLNDVQSVFCFDQEKRNMLALFGRFTLDELEHMPLAADIYQYMDKQTRVALQGRPLAFVEYWADLDNGKTMMMQNAPHEYMTVMKRRAKELERVMYGVEEHENVVRVNFRRTA